MPLSCVALDLETTGLDAERDAIIEIGCVKLIDDHILAEWTSLVNPGRPIPLKITQLTGIGDADVSDAPPLRHVGHELTRFIGTLPVVGHNIGFDLGFLQARGLYHDNPAVDTFELASLLLPRQDRYTLGNLAATFAIQLPDAHRALADARASMSLLLALVDYGGRLPIELLSEIVKLTGRSQWPLAPLFREMANRAATQTMTSPARRGRQVVPGRATWTSGEAPEPLHARNVPQPVDEAALAELLAPAGPAASVFPGYEYRPQQIDMLRAVTQALNQRQHLLVEAGTGTGKSLAYLLPAAQYAVQNGKRVVVSTNTINLQDQLFLKDIPDVQQLLPVPFTAALVKGRSNYLCPRRFNHLRTRTDLNDDELRMVVRSLIWLQYTQTGDRDELRFINNGEQTAWNRICADRELCTATHCQELEGGPCFFYQARAEAEGGHLVIINHALLLSDVAADNRVLPGYQHLIIDEAHHLVDAITQQLGFSLNGLAFLGLLNELQPVTSGRSGLLDNVQVSLAALGFPAREQAATWVQRAQEEIDACRTRLPDFWRTLHSFIVEAGHDSAQYDTRVRLTSGTRAQPLWDRVEIQWENLALHLRQVAEALDRLAELCSVAAQQRAADFEALATDLGAADRRLRELDAQVTALISEPDPNGIYWIGQQAENERAPSDPLLRLSLHAAPLHVGGLVEQHFLRSKESVILTSATLRTAGSFDFLAERLHMEDEQTLAVGSPFDFEVSTLLYLPTDMPEPNGAGYQPSVERTIVETARATGGRMLVLFTAYNQLKRTHAVVAPQLALDDIVVYEQGGGTSRRQLMENFKTTERAVLLGTRSFWEGVDIVGEALSCLVIVRLPFAVPNDPIFAARSETFDEPFLGYAVPDAILRFRQGFGRLIRSKTDRGVCIVLDRRVLSKNYGQLFIESLPACTTVRGPLANIPAQAGQWLAPGNR